jgi:hypothetical protein
VNEDDDHNGVDCHNGRIREREREREEDENNKKEKNGEQINDDDVGILFVHFVQ